MLCINQARKGEFQEVECGNYFTFGDLKDCPDDCLKNWAEEQSWYNPEVHFSFIDVGDYLYSPYRVAVVKKTVVYVLTGGIDLNSIESYKNFEKWQIKNHVIYK